MLTPATAHINIQPSEILETTTARSPNKEKARSVLSILSGSPHRPILTSSFSISPDASEPSKHFSAKVDTATAIASFNSQSPALQPRGEESSPQENVVQRKSELPALC